MQFYAISDAVLCHFRDIRWWEVFPSAEMQLAYSIDLGDWSDIT